MQGRRFPANQRTLVLPRRKATISVSKRCPRIVEKAMDVACRDSWISPCLFRCIAPHKYPGTPKPLFSTAFSHSPQHITSSSTPANRQRNSQRAYHQVSTASNFANLLVCCNQHLTFAPTVQRLQHHIFQRAYQQPSPTSSEFAVGRSAHLATSFTNSFI